MADLPAAILILAQPAGLAKAAGVNAGEIRDSPGYAANFTETARFFGLFLLDATLGKVETFKPARPEQTATSETIV